MSIIVIIFILWYNSQQLIISSAFLFPLSIDKITYWDEYYSSKSNFVIGNDSKYKNYYLHDKNGIKDLISSLDENKNYIISLEFKPSFSEDVKTDVPILSLSKPILINKHSSITTITLFIDRKLDEMVDLFYLDDSIIHDSDGEIGPYIRINYFEFYMV